MNSLEKLRKAFSKSLNIDLDMVHDDLTYNSIVEWDSVAHMALIADIESAFDIMLDTDDIVDMSSVRKAREILSKYNISFE